MFTVPNISDFNLTKILKSRIVRTKMPARSKILSRPFLNEFSSTEKYHLLTYTNNATRVLKVPSSKLKARFFSFVGLHLKVLYYLALSMTQKWLWTEDLRAHHGKVHS